MQDVLNFYLDESGPRKLDKITIPRTKVDDGSKCDFFAFGGILIKEIDEEFARSQYQSFCDKWKIDYPLHSTEIRGKHKNFSWVGTLSQQKQDDFYTGLGDMLISLPVLGLACVVDRPGYSVRYTEKYKSERWQICKTAFAIAVERAAKYAKMNNQKLRILPERCSKKEDTKLKNYYESFRNNGLPFNPNTSGQYNPLTCEDFQVLLREFKLKNKSSPMMQIADMYLWPMCIGGYHSKYAPYKELIKHKRLINCVSSTAGLGPIEIKYSCFDFKRSTV